MLAFTVTTNDIHSQGCQVAEGISVVVCYRPKENIVLANGGISRSSEASFGLAAPVTSLRRTCLQEVKENLFKD